ncbi:hypothetical protein [Streptomyces paromomycinus]|uniref:Uncharacterized protein n=1 Tax=Streptomyces paromomycinus TaxID=92743 RepID=A0A401W3M7_STREY|nr:hypothetical protein [Streptomyces paromomycinus]GCD43914.1 hypothetical protein GKJPGBOP_03600 [Streptomyces paromomycinus]
MNASQQHMLDAYRAARRGESAPVLPGAGDVQAVREIRRWLRFQAVVTAPADRPLARFRRAVRRALTRRPVRPVHLRRTARPDRAEPLPHPPLGPSSASVSTPTMTGHARLCDPCG